MNKHPEIIPIIVVIFVKISFLLQCHLQSIEKKKKKICILFLPGDSLEERRISR